MEVITDFKKLEGKTIAFSHMPQFTNAIVLGTTDKSVLAVKQELNMNCEDYETRLLSPREVINIIRSNSYLEEQFVKKKLFNVEDYLAEKKREQEIEEEKRKKRLEEREKEELRRLLKKYGKEGM